MVKALGPAQAVPTKPLKLFRRAWTTHNSIANSFHHRNVHSLRDEDVVLAQEDETRSRGGLKDRPRLLFDDAKLTWERVFDVGASSSSIPGNGARKLIDGL
jgi:hypothetical protein